MSSTATARVFGRKRIVLRDVDWREYGYFLRMLANRRGIRLTYDRGKLEIMTVSLEHERFAEFLGWMVLALAQILKLDLEPGGMTNLRLRQQMRGLQPDKCYWSTSEQRVRRKTRIDLRKDPPPELAIEVDITSSSLGRMDIYAALKVAEVWRFNGRTLTFQVLDSNGIYRSMPSSRPFPLVTPADVVRFVKRRNVVGSVRALEEFQNWVRQKIAGTGKP